jgi:glycosyltransferase involved in cell wall biosynthesis
MARPRVLHVFKDYWPTPGGVERAIQTIVRGCADDFESTILVNAAGPRTRVEYRDGATIVRAGTLARVAMTPLSPSFLHELRRARADLVHLHYPNPPGEVGYATLRRRTPMVLSYHNDLVRPSWAVPLYRPWARRMLHTARQIIVGDARTIEASPELPAHRSRCTVVPYGVDGERLRPTAMTTALTTRLRQQSRGLRVLFVGRFRYYKGLDVLIRAVRAVDATLLLVGSGPEEQRLRRLVGSLGLEDRVRFVGAVSEAALPAYYHAADVLALPSVYRSESFGLALAEAHTCGLPTISTELGTATSVVNRHDETGLVVPPGSVEALSEALSRLAQDPALRERLGRGAARLSERFSAQRMVAQTRRIYSAVLDSA